MSISELVARLNAAAEASAAVTIRYALGSRATTHRIVPAAAIGTVLRAHDLDANLMRIFLLAHVEQVDVPAPALPPQDEPPPSEQERLAALVQTLTNFGWHVQLSSGRLAVHRLHPDGRPLGVAAAAIRRNAGMAAPKGLMRRPWTVVTPGIARAQSFRSLDEAISLFLRQTAQHAPALRRRRPIT